MGNISDSASSFQFPFPTGPTNRMSAQKLRVYTEPFPPLKAFFPFSASKESLWKVIASENIASKVQTQLC